MKSFLFSFSSFLLIIFVGITFLGCADNFDNSIVTAPTITDNTFIHSDSPLYTSAFTTKTWLQASKFIDGETGGELIIDTTYINYQGRQINVYGRLKFKEYSFQGLTFFKMLLRPEEASIALFPNMEFEIEVELTVEYKGIDLEALGHTTSGHVDFVFLDDNGEIEIILNEFCKVNIGEQRIKVNNAKLSHFSQYGWSISDSTTPQLELISLPSSSAEDIDTLVTQYKEIDGHEGGKFDFVYSYQGGPFDSVTIVSKLDFADHTFEGTQVISQTLNTNYAAMKYGPSMQFDKDVKLNLVITGLDLSNVDPNTLDFVFINEDGSVENVVYDNIIVNVSTGTIEVDNAKLTHFSRYGFVH